MPNRSLRAPSMTRLFAAFAALTLLGCGGSSTTSSTTPSAVVETPSAGPAEVDRALEAKVRAMAGVFKALPARPATTYAPAMIDLGRSLYYEARLSKNHDVSCNSCHLLNAFGVDGQPTSPGHKRLRGGRNSPTTLNAALQLSQFWDGRAATVEEQAKGPVLNPIEMAMPDEASVVAVLESIPGYVTAFAAAFPAAATPVTYENMVRAIGAFERGLLTPSPFDAWLSGDTTALSGAELAGLDTFVSTGCAACHAGVLLGGSMYQKLGVVQPYPTDDVGRAAITGNVAETHFFKVPSLRNTTKTGPWFHDGSIGELSEAVVLMGRHQLGRELSAEQTASIVTFLGALTGTVDPDYVARPELPESGASTPAPDPT